MLWTPLLVLVHLDGMLALCLLLGLRPSRIQVFSGPAWARADWGETRVELGCVPLAAAISFPESCDWQRWRRLLALSGPLACLGLAAALLGPAQAGEHFRSGFLEILRGAWEPLHYGLELVAKTQALPAYPQQVGVLAAKMAALNCLPLSTLNGGQVLLPAVWQERWLPVSLLLTLGLLGSWTLAVSAFLWKGA